MRYFYLCNLYRTQEKEGEVGNEVNDYEISCQYLDDGVMCEVLFLFDFVIIAIGPWCASVLFVGEGQRQERGSGQRRWRGNEERLRCKGS